MRFNCRVMRNNLVYVCISIRILRPTQDRMNFFSFSKARFLKHLKLFCSRYCNTLPLCEDASFFVTDLPPIQSSIQPKKIEKWTSKLNYHEESTQLRRRVSSQTLASLVAKV